MNKRHREWYPHIDTAKKPLCYRTFNDPPREGVCSYCPTYKTLKDGKVHESVTETPAGGEIRNYRIVSSPITDKDGNVVAAIEMVEDITEQKEAQDKLRESEDRYRTIFETTPAASMIVEEDTTISLVNREFEIQSGYSKEEVEGKRSWTEFVHMDDLERMIEYHKLRRVDPAAAPRNYEARFVDREGRIKEVFLTVGVVPGTKKSMASILDITARKRAEGALRESERRLSDIIDFLPDATFAIDKDGKVIAWNRALEEMTGSKAEDTLGKGDYEYALPFYGVGRPMLIDLVFVSDKKIESEYAFFKRQGDIVWAENEVRLKGDDRVLWGKASPLYDSKGNIVGAIETVRDITERRRAEEALRRREMELEIKSRNLEELNTALKVLLKQREKDREELEEKVLVNIKQLVMPYIEILKGSKLGSGVLTYVNVIESNLKDVVSPFAHRLTSKYVNFTPKELQIANLIKEGKTTKEIAELLRTSAKTIDFHRNNMRDKLGLKNRKTNLRAYLLTLS